ncbi:hypothetical protein RBB79_11125 [Tunturiibacter empetritectus]|uniref:Uncharacterized protein n=2 Tax=Tunturiibacter TaxID=3154218 RepID=A0A852VFV6_9BACT|nr:hypothetical protein [Edaphobacter lichenicola]NYF90121.1 hypothetical protein [Edaphobacter lichenicola]
MRVRRLVTLKIESTGALKDWQNVKPIHSNHWGEQPIHPAE